MNPRALLATAAPGLFVFLWSTGFVGALGQEDFRVTGSGEFLFTLAWLTLVLSLGPATLLNALIRSGTATHVASLFYLAPPGTALIAWLLFDEHPSGAALAGMPLVALGVYLARK